VLVSLGRVHSVVGIEAQAGLDELLGKVTYLHLFVLGVVDFEGLQDGPVLHDLVLAHPVPEGSLPEKHLVEDDSNRPDVNFGGYFGSAVLEGLRREVVVGADALRGELDASVIAFLHDLAESKVDDLDDSLVEHDVAGLEVVVDHLLLEAVEVVKGAQHLLDDDLGFSLRNRSVPLHVARHLGARTVLQFEDHLIPSFVDFDNVLEFGDVGMGQCLLDIYLSHGVPVEFLLELGSDPVIEDDPLDRHHPIGVHVVGLVDFPEAPGAQQFKCLVSVVDDGPSFSVVLAPLFLFGQLQPLFVVFHLQLLVLELLPEFLQLPRVEFLGTLQAQVLTAVDCCQLLLFFYLLEPFLVGCDFGSQLGEDFSLYKLPVVFYEVPETIVDLVAVLPP
jgi:hypothetical protein